MPSRFEDCLVHIKRWEGGRVDDPDDPGGRTNQGVTQKVYDEYRTQHALPKKDVFNIEDHEVKDIYLKRYWSPLCGSSLPVGLDIVVFNAGVNAGIRRAGKWLQIALGMDTGDCDGVVGVQTLKYVTDAIYANDVDRVITAFQGLLEKHYDSRVELYPNLKKFRNGWQNRLDDFTRLAQECRA